MFDGSPHLLFVFYRPVTGGNVCSVSGMVASTCKQYLLIHKFSCVYSISKNKFPRMHTRMHGRTPSISMYPPPPLWICHDIQGHGGMHDWVKWCINQCRKSEVSTLTRHSIATSKSRSKVGQGHSYSNSSKAMMVCITGSNIVHVIRNYQKLSEIITLTRFCIAI